MEGYSGIPQEIRTFFKEDYGQILLVKGTPGAGKSGFALTLLCTLKGNGAYLSTRIDPDTLYMQHPWIRNKIAAENIIDATQSERERTTDSRTVTIKPLKYVDAPDFLKAVYTRTEAMTNPIIIIDSWDAVASYTGHYELKERERIEHNLCDFSRKTKTKIILIVEYTKQSALDYLVDGVIHIESDMYKERRVRRMNMQKLRGCQIANPIRLFTLHNGLFKAFTEFKGVELKEGETLVPGPLPDPEAARISTGIRDLDRIIDGYGTLNLFEGDYTTYGILARALAINSLNLGRSLILTSTEQDEFVSRFSPYVTEEYKENIAVVEGTRNLQSVMKGEKSVVLLNLEEIEDADKAVGEVSSVIRERGGAVLCFGGKEGETGEELSSSASVYIKTKFISGIPCLYGEMPRTEIHALEMRDFIKGWLYSNKPRTELYASEMEPTSQKSFPVITLTPVV